MLEPGAMKVPPRRSDAHLFDAEVIKRGLWQGAGLLVMLLAVFAFTRSYSKSDDVARALTFGVLVVSNHQSHFDPPLVGIGCWRQMNFVARESLMTFRPFGWLIRSIGAIPIDRDGIGLSGIKESLKLLKRGEMVLIFPEGTRTPPGQGLGRSLQDDHFGGTQQDCSAPAVRNELGRRRSLTAVGLEEKRPIGHRRMSGGCCCRTWRAHRGGQHQD